MAIFSDTVTLVRRNWRRTLASFAPMTAMLATLGAFLARGPLVATKDTSSFFILLAFSIAAPVLMMVAGFGLHRESIAVEAGADGLRAGGELLMARDEMAEGFIDNTTAGRVSVRIVGREGARKLRLEVLTRDRAVELLRALRLDVMHRTLELRGLCNVDYVNLPVRIVVGADGVLVSHVGFVPYGDIDDIVRDGSVSVIKRAGSGDVRLISTLQGDVLFERMREGLEAFRRGEHATDPVAMVARQGRSVDDWMKALGALLTSSDYRAAAVTPDVLWRIAEDPAAPASARAGAATALRPSLDEEGRQRMRIAAAASASPKLRVVLAAATEADEEPLARAMKECADD